MRRIRRGQAPAELTHWRNNQPLDNGRKLNCTYDAIPCKDVIKQQLLKEQGYLCGYTGIPIDTEQSHIEHVKPQSSCDKEIYEDTDYSNFIAAYPEPGKSCEFGAVYKASWYDPTMFISPLNDICEKAFEYHRDGKISARSSPYSHKANETIRKLALDHKNLIEMREVAIKQVLYDKHLPITNAQLERIIAHYATFFNQSQRLPAFCFVIVQAAEKLLHQRRKEQQKQVYSKKTALGRKRRRR